MKLLVDQYRPQRRRKGRKLRGSAAYWRGYWGAWLLFRSTDMAHAAVKAENEGQCERAVSLADRAHILRERANMVGGWSF